LVAELEACFVVIDSAGQKLAYVYYEDEPQRRAAAKLLTKDEARRIAANIAKLPEARVEDDNRAGFNVRFRGVKRTSYRHALMSAFEPKRTLAFTYCGGAFASACRPRSVMMYSVFRSL
jgi:hypothetical protein